MTPPTLQQQHAERLHSFRTGRWVTLALLLNIVAYCLGHVLLGGSALLAEPYEGESALRPLHGDEFPVSSGVEWYSLLHGASALLTVPSLILCAVMLAWEWVQLRRLRLRLG